MRLATIGAEDAVKHADKVNRRHWSDAGAAALIQCHHAPVNIVGGFKFPDAPEIEIAPIGNVSSPMSVPALADVGSRDDPLAIPEFLRRPMQATINLNEEYQT
jgi:hypothetical protein